MRGIVFKASLGLLISCLVGATGCGGKIAFTGGSGTSPVSNEPSQSAGSGTAYAVDLAWNPPLSSPDPVVAYLVFRSATGGNYYEQVSTNPVTSPYYVDQTVQNGLTYDYVVLSLGSTGNLSISSNVASVTIP